MKNIILSIKKFKTKVLKKSEKYEINKSYFGENQSLLLLKFKVKSQTSRSMKKKLWFNIFRLLRMRPRGKGGIRSSTYKC